LLVIRFRAVCAGDQTMSELGGLSSLPPSPDAKPLLDGMRLLEDTRTNDMVEMAFSFEDSPTGLSCLWMAIFMLVLAELYNVCCVHVADVAELCNVCCVHVAVMCVQQSSKQYAGPECTINLHDTSRCSRSRSAMNSSSINLCFLLLLLLLVACRLAVHWK